MVLGKIIISRALFRYLYICFGHKHPRLICPRYSTIAGFDPQNGLYTAHSKAQGNWVRCGAARERNTACPRSTAQVQCAQHAAMQVLYSAGAGAVQHGKVRE